MRLKKTERGFFWGEFRDYYDNSCSIQESSIVYPPCVWLGVDQHRMHLTRKMARELIRRLQVFVDTGRLKPPPTTKQDGGEK